MKETAFCYNGRVNIRNILFFFFKHATFFKKWNNNVQAKNITLEITVKQLTFW